MIYLVLLEVLLGQVLEVALRKCSLSLTTNLRNFGHAYEYVIIHLHNDLAFFLVHRYDVTERSGFTVHLNLGLEVVLLNIHSQ